MLKNRKRRKRIKKFFELLILFIIIGWSSIFLFDYYRAQKHLPPIIVLKEVKNTYSDGQIMEYYSLGYVYRSYERTTITDTEFKPFWIAKREVEEPKSKYPILKNDYEIPPNEEHAPKVDNVLYFYHDDELYYTYKCQNSEDSCHQSLSGHDRNNPEFNDILLSPFSDYVFIDDSTPDQKITYIVNTKKNKIEYQVQEIIASQISNKQGIGIKNQYIVKNNDNKYGIITIDNNIKLTTPYNYDYIKYNLQSNTYTVKSKYWMVTDFQENFYVSDTEIADAYLINNQYYIKIIKKKTINEKTINTYNVIDTDHTLVFINDSYALENINDVFIISNNFLELEIKTIQNKVISQPKITLHLNPLNTDAKLFTVEKNKDHYVIIVPYGEGNKVDKYYFNLQNHQLIKKEINIVNN